MSLQDRIVELEIRAAHQDRLIDQLDHVLREFTARVERLESLLEDLKNSADAEPIGPPNDPPPHY